MLSVQSCDCLIHLSCKLLTGPIRSQPHGTCGQMGQCSYQIIRGIPLLLLQWLQKMKSFWPQVVRDIWAILVAFAIAEQPLVVHSDSLTIVNQFNDLLRLGHVQVEWTHTNWWGFLFTLVHQRSGRCEHPLQVMWCPAHLLEHIPAMVLTEAEAHAAGSNRRDIILNRRADEFAKQQTWKLAVSYKAELTTKETDVFARQLWLTKLNRTCKKPDRGPADDPPVERAPISQVPPRQQCPRWPWDVLPDMYPWQVHNDVNLSFTDKPQLSSANFKVFLGLSKSLRRRLGEGLACSVFELAAFVFTQGWRFNLPAGTICTVQAYAAIIRAAISYCKPRQIIVAPLLLDKGNKCNGKTYPKGAFHGAEAYLDNVTLELLVRAFEKGAKATPSSWALPFDLLL